MIREVESASLCNNSAPDDSSCLKIRLEDAKVHQVILLKSKICMLSQKRVLNGFENHLTAIFLKS